MSKDTAATRNGAADHTAQSSGDRAAQADHRHEIGAALHAYAAPHRPPWTWGARCWEPDFRASDIQLKPLNRVEAKPLVWEGDGRLPRGAVTIIAGEHGSGKSLAAIDWAARISRGEPWSAKCAGESPAKQNGEAAPSTNGEPAPSASQPKNYGETVIAHAGDTTVELLRLRIDAAGAAPERVASLALAWPEKGQRFNFDTINNRFFGLTCAIRGTNNARLLVIDNLEAWAGNVQATPSTALLNFLLARLGELAAMAELAIVVLARLPRSGGQAAARKLDALCEMAPVVYLAAEDAEQPGRKLLLPVKNNLASPAPAKAFQVAGHRVAWSDEPVEATADEFLAPVARRREARHERESAARWLLAALADGPVASRELFRQARDCGISTRTLRRAAESLGLSPRKTSFDGPWQWQLGETNAARGAESAEQAAASEDGQPRAAETPPQRNGKSAAGGALEAIRNGEPEAARPFGADDISLARQATRRECLFERAAGWRPGRR
jgi:putative DNA primase/helicase